MDANAAKLIGAGLATISLAGVGVGIGQIFGSYISGSLRNPAAAPKVIGNVLLGFALTEAVALYAHVKAVETGIVEATTRAIADLRNVAGEAARELVTRLVGVAPAPADVTEAVEAVGRERTAAMHAIGGERA